MLVSFTLQFVFLLFFSCILSFSCVFTVCFSSLSLLLTGQDRTGQVREGKGKGGAGEQGRAAGDDGLSPGRGKVSQV